MDEEARAARQAAVVRLLEAEGLDALLVTSLPNIRYLTGFSGSAALVLATASGVLLVTDFRYEAQAEAEVGDAARVVVERTSAWDRLFREIASAGQPGTIGFEAHVLSAKDAERFATAGKAWRWRAAPELVERLRVRKSPAEVAAVRAAAALAGDALRATLGAVRCGQTEREIAGLLEGHLRRLGSEAHPFPTIVASGPRTAWPHARTSARPVARGEWLLLDFGAQVDGYCADITRTVVVGARATDAQRVLYDLVHAAQRTARERVRAGMSAREADALARCKERVKHFDLPMKLSSAEFKAQYRHLSIRRAARLWEPSPPWQPRGSARGKRPRISLSFPQIRSEASLAPTWW